MTTQTIIFNKNKGFLPSVERSAEEKKTYGVLNIFHLDKNTSEERNGTIIYKPKSLLKQEPCSKLYFRNTGSIDSMIEALQWVKKNMINYVLIAKEENNEISIDDGPTQRILSGDSQSARETVSGNIDT